MGTHSYPALGFDPAPGNPETLESVSRTCTALGSDFGSDAHMLHRIGESAVWDGEGGAAFDQTAIDLSDDLDNAGNAYGGVGSALWTYASVLRSAQSEARAAEADAADAKRRAGNLQDSVDDLSRQIDDAPDDADTSDDEAARSRLQGRLSDANGDYDAAVRRAERAQGRARDAASAAARRINDLAGTRPYEEPGWLDRATSWVGDKVSDVAGAVDRFIDEHADLLRSISGVLKIVSAVAGVLSFIPILAPIMAPIAIAAGAAALLIDAALVVTGNGSWKALLVDAALTVIPFGRVAAGIGRGAMATFRASRAATRVLRTARAAEPGVTRSLQTLASRHGGRLVGLQYRLKGHESLVRKIKDDMVVKGLSPDEAASQISDSLRYTVEYPSSTIASRTSATLDDLATDGYQATKPLKNTWQEGNPYKGMNGQFRTPDGQPVEIQFHTPESFATKQATHQLFETSRNMDLPLETRQAAWDEMARMSDELQHPPGIENLGDPVIYTRPS